MRHYRIEFLDDVKTPGFMETTDAGDLVRLTDVDGNTLDELPHTSYRTLDTKPSKTPDWASTNGEKITAKEALKAEYVAAVKAGTVTTADVAAWNAEAALP